MPEYKSFQPVVTKLQLEFNKEMQKCEKQVTPTDRAKFQALATIKASLEEEDGQCMWHFAGALQKISEKLKIPLLISESPEVKVFLQQVAKDLENFKPDEKQIPGDMRTQAMYAIYQFNEDFRIMKIKNPDVVNNEVLVRSTHTQIEGLHMIATEGLESLRMREMMLLVDTMFHQKFQQEFNAHLKKLMNSIEASVFPLVAKDSPVFAAGAGSGNPNSAAASAAAASASAAASVTTPPPASDAKKSCVIC